MKKRSLKKTTALGLSVMMAVSMTACGGSGSSSGQSSAADSGKEQSAQAADSDEKPITLRLSSSVSSKELEERNTGMSAGLMTWVDTVEAESGGSIKIDVFSDSQLASGTDAIVNGIQTGAFEVAHFNTASWSEYTNAFAELNVPYLFSGYEDAHKVLESEIGQAMKDQLENDVQGIKPLTYISIGFRNVTASKSIESVADMKGLKIRTTNDTLQIAAMESMGCAVTSVPISELYSALQTKMVDAQENPLSTIYSQKFYEVNKYACLTQHSYTSTFVFMNSDTYNNLSDRQKAAIDKANEAALKASEDAANKADEEYKGLLEKEGMTVYTPNEEQMQGFKEAASTCWNQAKEIMGEERYNKLMEFLGIQL